ncbi:Retrotransposon protein [Seminavis robusta]|uniref:Retrotransposon protein n=1 Tax=Seminavis robusta TaxID=568900 RepID=A0A9N8F2D8_9STRA|nr:Retrotransposon protein [Seminavis robusta]|eukprot:Sro3491_g348580.1 Retrotransposon protein (308) ;mRNA; r:4815-5738
MDSSLAMITCCEFIGTFIDLMVLTITSRNLQLATAVVFMRSDHGPILGRIHQGAVMYDGRTIACPGQMEHFGCCVHEKAKTVTGVDPYFVTPNGFRVPMAMRNGLPYVDWRPPTDAEMEDDSIPLIDLTSPHPWDPSCLDSVPSDDWYDTQSTTVLDDADSPLDSLGRLKTMDANALTPSRPTPKQSIDRRGIIAAMADLVKDDLVPASADDAPALLSRQCHHYDSSSDDDSDLEDDYGVEDLRQCFARVPDLMPPMPTPLVLKTQTPLVMILTPTLRTYAIVLESKPVASFVGSPQVLAPVPAPLT